jgi:TolB-like protein
MRYFLIFLLSPMLWSCASDDEIMEADDNSDEYELMVLEASPPEDKNFVKSLSYRITEELIANIDLKNSRAPMAVTTPVLASNFKERIALSHFLQQSLISDLHNHQFFILDINISDYMQITQDGEFMLSREWKHVAPELEIQMVLVTTLVPDIKGININSRIVNIHSHRVMASAQVYVRAEEMKNFFRYSRLITENADEVLERNEEEGQQAIYLLDEVGASDEDEDDD